MAGLGASALLTANGRKRQLRIGFSLPIIVPGRSGIGALPSVAAATANSGNRSLSLDGGNRSNCP
jgi:hypothetical protein